VPASAAPCQAQATEDDAEPSWSCPLPRSETACAAPLDELRVRRLMAGTRSLPLPIAGASRPSAVTTANRPLQECPQHLPARSHPREGRRAWDQGHVSTPLEAEAMLPEGRAGREARPG
jgi:hypothetical protein